jgi:hypothetical protein
VEQNARSLQSELVLHLRGTHAPFTHVVSLLQRTVMHFLSTVAPSFLLLLSSGAAGDPVVVGMHNPVAAAASSRLHRSPPVQSVSRRQRQRA